MASQSFDPIWRRIVSCAGQEFKTVTGLEFNYTVEGQVLHPSRTRYNLPRSEFEKAYNLMPLTGPGQINRIVRGPAYVYTILTDPRISSGSTVTDSNE